MLRIHARTIYTHFQYERCFRHLKIRSVRPPYWESPVEDSPAGRCDVFSSGAVQYSGGDDDDGVRVPGDETAARGSIDPVPPPRSHQTLFCGYTLTSRCFLIPGRGRSRRRPYLVATTCVRVFLFFLFFPPFFFFYKGKKKSYLHTRSTYLCIKTKQTKPVPLLHTIIPHALINYRYRYRYSIT